MSSPASACTVSEAAGRVDLDEVADPLASLFKALGNANRLRMLHGILVGGERSAGDIAADAGMTPQATSNQLQRLTDQGVLASRRDGTHVYYRVVDPCVAGLLDLGVCLLEERH